MLQQLEPGKLRSRSIARDCCKYLGAAICAAVLLLAGCGSSSSKTASTTPPNPPTTPGGPVIVGTKPNSLPSPPAKTQSNQYAGLDMQGNIDLTLQISHVNETYYYQQPGAGSSNSAIKSGGVLSQLLGLEYLAETDGQNSAYTFSGFSVESESAAAFLEQGFGGFPGNDLIVGVSLNPSGCIAPMGSVQFNFLQVPVTAPLTYRAATDTLYGSAGLSYANGVFNYTSPQQVGGNGSPATTNTIPFAQGYCVEAPEGYGVQSVQIANANGGESVLAYVGATGMIVGKVDHEANFNGGVSGRSGFVGMVQPAGAVDLSTVTQGSYKGFYLQPGIQQPANPAYFGTNPNLVTAPVFSQTSTSIVGGTESIDNLLFGPVPPAPVAGNIRIDFGSQDTNNPGLFPAATITELDPSNLCAASQRSTGPDGNTYCSFSVPALIAESYGKYTILLAGFEPTSGYPLFYSLVQQ